MFMKYLIKLEDWGNGREALIECPANMLLEELCVKIKVEHHLPYLDYEAHCFRGRGYYYVPDDIDDRSLAELVGDWDPYDFWHETVHMPSKRFRRSTKRVRLKYALTVKGSSINYSQISPNDWNLVRCTLIDRY